MMAIKIEKIMLDKLEKLEEGVTKWAMSRRERECKLSTPRRDALERSGNASLRGSQDVLDCDFSYLRDIEQNGRSSWH